MRRLVFLLTFGLGGAAILISLGVWQVQRLAWKQEVLTRIDSRIQARPTALPAQPDPETDNYLPVQVTGEFEEPGLLVFTSKKGAGAGFRVITPLALEGRTVMIDRGFVIQDGAIPAPPDGAVTITGNLRWPEEVDAFTPAPEADTNVLYARDVPYMAARLGTEPILIALRDGSWQDDVAAFPIDTAAIPNNHLQYAITWFSLSAIWLAMTAVFLRRKPGANQS